MLDRILADTRALVAQRRQTLPETMLERMAEKVPAPIDLIETLRTPGVSIIAEIKRASPSRGALRTDLDPVSMAHCYVAAGADALSILTEPSYFRGSPEDLTAVHTAMVEYGPRRPLLRKDFILSRYQLLEARVWGADAALLIVAALTDAELTSLHHEALAMGLAPLVEVHDEGELTRALACGATLIGINNRNLRDFSVTIETTARLRDRVPPDCCVVSESGIHSVAQMRQLAAWGVDAALIGEALVTSTDPAATLALFREAGR
ncbi:MAG: indole-3-glycerol phosphate synthase TrpC [Chloroflexi bacterium]|nr:indole-3-glycerol phosphate synthase TrpC [Chloroflexota bacterium]